MKLLWLNIQISSLFGHFERRFYEWSVVHFFGWRNESTFDYHLKVLGLLFWRFASLSRSNCATLRPCWQCAFQFSNSTPIVALLFVKMTVILICMINSVFLCDDFIVSGLFSLFVPKTQSQDICLIKILNVYGETCGCISKSGYALLRQ